MIITGMSIGARKEILFNTGDIKGFRLDRKIVIVPGLGQVALKQREYDAALKEFRQDPAQALMDALNGCPLPEEAPAIEGEPMVGPLSLKEAMEATGLTRDEIFAKMEAGEIDGARPGGRGPWQIYLPQQSDGE